MPEYTPRADTDLSKGKPPCLPPMIIWEPLRPPMIIPMIIGGKQGHGGRLLPANEPGALFDSNHSLRMTVFCKS